MSEATPKGVVFFIDMPYQPCYTSGVEISLLWKTFLSFLVLYRWLRQHLSRNIINNHNTILHHFFLQVAVLHQLLFLQQWLLLVPQLSQNQVRSLVAKMWLIFSLSLGVLQQEIAIHENFFCKRIYYLIFLYRNFNSNARWGNFFWNIWSS